MLGKRDLARKRIAGQRTEGLQVLDISGHKMRGDRDFCVESEGKMLLLL